ncbi:MAG: triacylglycerol lipase [Myxococcota bacterium]|nr:triacylglycerol lipase [Myxococcota bacterium]
MRRQVYLVPGFFGFSRLGGMNYFQSVGKVLREALARHGVEVEIVECRTKPTASIRHRADRLVDEVTERGGLEADELHFVGHSTGGLDARLLCSPGLRVRPDNIERRIIERTRSVVTVATPHHGTPLASFFMTILGRQLLEALTVLATSRGGRASLVAASQLVGLVASADQLLGRDSTILDSVAEDLTSYAADGREEIWTYLNDIASDQGAMVQLMPESIHLFNAAVTDHQAIRYSSLVAIAPPPPSRFGVGDLASPVRAALESVFTLLYTVTSRENPKYRYPDPDEDVLRPYRDALPFELGPRSNDGIVPTLSQIYGRVIDVVLADHLDVVGQFVRDDLPHGDWLPSGSDFDWVRFEAVWDGVAREIAGAGDTR